MILDLVHRVGPKTSAQARMTVVKFNRYKNRELALAKAKKKRKVGKANVFVTEQSPKETVHARKTL